MTEMWKVVWKQRKKDVLNLTIMPAAIMLAALAFYKINKGVMFSFINLIYHLPESAIAFLGIHQNLETGNFLFFSSFLSIPIQFWFAWKACILSFEVIQDNCLNRSIHSLCNQKYSRKEFIVIQYRCINRLYFMAYIIWRLIVLVTALAGSFNQQQQINTVRSWLSATLISIIVYLMLISLFYMLAAGSKKECDGKKIVNVILFSTVCVANIYKVLYLLQDVLAFAGKSLKGAERITAWLEILHEISPISWLNPFWEDNILNLIIKAVICLIITIICCSAGILRFQRRSIM